MPCWLLLAGDGPLRPVIEEQVRQHVTPGVLMPGFLNQSELPLAYAASDLLALCSSHETWGLVVNEAMNFGLPIVASDRVGCAADLVKSGWNGFVFPHQDVGALADALGKLIESENMRREFGIRSLELVSNYSVENCADGVLAACLSSTKRSG
jgi:glycosyltransferase involved in cell wall biosynthesis